MGRIDMTPAMTGSRRKAGRTIAVAVVALLGLVAISCSTTPRAVLNVPGTYVADLWQPVLWSPSGVGFAVVVMCLDEPSAVHIGTGQGGEGSIGSIDLEWNGVHHTASDLGNPVTLTTPVLDPGCGLLNFGVDCCHVDHYLAVEVTKV